MGSAWAHVAGARMPYRDRDLRSWSVAERGRHFPMLEVPDAFCAEIRAACARPPT